MESILSPKKDNISPILTSLIDKLSLSIDSEIEKLKCNLIDIIIQQKEKIFKKLSLAAQDILFENKLKQNTINLLTTNKIKLDVGGVLITTSLESLTKYKSSKLAQMFSGEFILNYDKDEKIFIDRDGKYFQHILNCIRVGEYIQNNELLESFLIKEFEFFELFELIPKDLEITKNEKVKNNLDIFNKKHEIVSSIENIPVFSDIKKSEEKIITENKMVFMELPNIKNNFLLKNGKSTVERIKKTFSDQFGSYVLGNIPMAKGKYEWDIILDKYSQDYPIYFGVCEKNKFPSKLDDWKEVNDISFLLSSMKDVTNKMTHHKKELKDFKNGYKINFYLDFEQNIFRISGDNLFSVSDQSIKDKTLNFILLIFNKLDKITIQRFKEY